MHGEPRAADRRCMKCATEKARKAPLRQPCVFDVGLRGRQQVAQSGLAELVVPLRETRRWVRLAREAAWHSARPTSSRKVRQPVVNRNWWVSRLGEGRDSARKP